MKIYLDMTTGFFASKCTRRDIVRIIGYPVFHPWRTSLSLLFHFRWGEFRKQEAVKIGVNRIVEATGLPVSTKEEWYRACDSILTIVLLPPEVFYINADAEQQRLDAKPKDTRHWKVRLAESLQKEFEGKDAAPSLPPLMREDPDTEASMGRFVIVLCDTSYKDSETKK